MDIVDILGVEEKKIILILLILLIVALFFKKQRNMILGAGVYRIINWILDNPVWITAQLIWGSRGVLVMIIGAIIYNVALLIYFRNKEAKFILWSSLKEFSEREEEYKNKFKEWKENKTPWKFALVISSYIPMKIFFFLLRVVKVPFWGNFSALIILSIFEDPFVTATYISHGRKKKMDAKMISVFMVSIFISLAYWSARNGLITELIVRPILF